jgi:hypothetical protein
MDKRNENKIEKSYRFFKNKAELDKVFTLSELAEATGWSEGTAKTYLSKKWDSILEKTEEGYKVNNIARYSETEYTRMMSQVNKNSQDPFKPDLDEDIERLVIKARESTLLALDIYNRPATMFKSEGFIVMMIIGWTALLHAIFHKRKQRYNYIEEDGTDKYIDGDLKAWELKKCLEEFFNDENNAIRKNIEFMIGLRNKIEHRFAPKIDSHIGGECQSLLLNFDELLTEEFGNYYSLRDSLVFPLQTANLKMEGRIDALKKFQGKHYDEIKEYIDVYREGISDEIYNDQKFSFRVYLVPKLGNHKNSSDMSMEFVKYDSDRPEELESQKKLITIIKNKLISTGNPDGLKPKQVIEKVEAKIGKPFKIHHHTRAWKFYKIRPDTFKKNHLNDYCYSDSAHEDYVYTPTWVDFLVRKLSNEEEYERVISHKI